MFNRRTFAIVSLLLAVVLLSGCLDMFKRKQTVNNFLEEVNIAYKSLNLDRVYDLYDFKGVSNVEEIKNEMKYQYSTTFEILKQTRGKLNVEVIPAEDEDAVVENANDAVINKGTIKFVCTLDPSLLKDVKLNDFSTAGREWLEVEFELFGDPGQSLQEYLTRELQEMEEMIDEEGLPFIDVEDIYDPIYLKRVNKTWKFDGKKMFEDSRPV